MFSQLFKTPKSSLQLFRKNQAAMLPNDAESPQVPSETFSSLPIIRKVGLDEVVQVVGQFRWRWLRRDNRLQGLFKLRDIALQHIPNYAEIYVGVIMNQAMPQARPALRVATSYGNGFFADPRGKSRR